LKQTGGGAGAGAGGGEGIGAFVRIGATGSLPPAKLAAENTLVMSAAARTIVDFLASDMAVSLE
jgi:hypothetical protein